MSPLDQLREWGYDVEESTVIDGVIVWAIDGWGLLAYVRDDDEAALEALADPVAHQERCDDYYNPPEASMPYRPVSTSLFAFFIGADSG